MKIPLKVRLKKIFAFIFGWFGEIDLNIFTGIFAALFLLGCGLKIYNAIMLGVFGYLLYIRIEETLIRYARILSKKK